MATRYDIEFEQGQKFLLNVQARNKSDNSIMSLVGYSAKMQVRDVPGGSNLYLDANTSNGMITVNGPAGIVSITIPGSTTAGMTFNTGAYDLDVYTTADNSFRLLEGYAALSLKVTV